LDFDGTLVESNQIKDRAFETIFNKWPNHKQEMMSWHYSNDFIDRREKFKYFVEKVLKLNDRDDLIEQLSKKFQELTRSTIIECPYVEGVENFLDYISHRYTVYLVSATPQLELEYIIRAKNLKVYFKNIYGAPINKLKILRNIISKEKLSSNEILYIGDSPKDQQCAKDLDIIFFGRQSNRVLQESSHYIFKDFNEIYSHLKKYYEV